MGDVPDVYEKPVGPGRPVVCVGEGGRQLIGGVREPLPGRPGSPAEQGSEYERGGMADLSMAFQPLAGRRHVGGAARKTGADFATFLRDLGDRYDATAGRAVRVCDNLNTHTPASRYEASEPAAARRLADRFEWHYTPKHGRWLDTAETALGVAARQRLGRRIPDRETLRREVAAREKARNKAVANVDRQFTTAKARVKRKKLYPTIQVQ
jgi:hypothetical protein